MILISSKFKGNFNYIFYPTKCCVTNRFKLFKNILNLQWKKTHLVQEQCCVGNSKLCWDDGHTPLLPSIFTMFIKETQK